MLRVLLIEDNPADEQLTRQAILDALIGANITSARDGEEAIRVLNSPGFTTDLIIIDLSLPKLNGLDVLERYRRDKNAPPVIALTGSVDPKERHRAATLGVSEYVTKSIRLDEYLSTIRAAIERWKPIDGRTQGET